MQPGQDPFASLPRRYRLMLRLLPAHLRDEHARELSEELAAEQPPMRRFTLDVLGAAITSHADVLRQDLRVTLRQLRHAPAFALVAIVTLSAGIGGNVAFFTLVDRVLLRPLPLPNADRLVSITEENPSRELRAFGISPANYRDAVRDTSLFAAAAPHGTRTGTLRVGEERERIVIAAVGGDFFRVVGEHALLGRALQPDDDVPNPQAVVLGYDLWQRAFDGDPSIVGREVEIDADRFRVVGVMPKGFTFPSAGASLWQPLGLSANDWTQRGARYLEGIALLRPGVTVEHAATAVSQVGRTLADAFPATNRSWTLRLEDARASIVSTVRAPLLAMWAAGALVLLIAIANVASLLLTRAVARERELALRVALGARVGRVLRQLATESAVLSSASAAIGVGLAWLVLHRVEPLVSQFVPRATGLTVDAPVVAYAAALAMGTAAVLTLFALPLARRDRIWRALGTGRGGPSRRRRRVQRAIVVVEVAVAVFVMIAGGLIARTLVRLLSQPLGFDPHAVTTFRIEPPWKLAPHGQSLDEQIAAIQADRERAGAQLAALIARLNALPGVDRTGAINRLPLTGDWWTSSIVLPDHPVISDADRTPAFVRPVTPDYFAAMGQRVLRGRGLSAADRSGSQRVVAVDAELARTLWGEADPIGREVLLDGIPGRPQPRARVVGVVESVRLDRLEGTRRPAFYVPFAQSFEGFYLNWGMDVVVRGAALTEAQIRGVARDVMPDAVVFNVASMDEVIARSTANRRFQLFVVGCFAALALLLATVGIGGTMLLSVRERREELAVRLALGAAPGRLWWAVQREGTRLAALGIALGLVAALSGAGAFRSVVYDIDPRDPVAVGGAAAFALLAAFLATAVAARRATHVDPAGAMKGS